ncbi:MAG: DUF1311 domain-containing protein [Actinobacteria bacterium]|nr:DUF1311 domain-containing protein [Actinomycetota bacterium]
MLGMLLFMVSCSAGGEDAEDAEPDSTAATATEGTDAACDGSTQADLNDCAIGELRDAEGKLEDVLTDVRPHAGARSEALAESQRLWLEYRDVFCEAHAFEEGSIQPLNVASCKTALTQARIDDVCSWLVPNAEPDAVGDYPETCR